MYEDYDGSSLGAALRRLDDGVVMQVPAAEVGKTEPMMLRGWLVTLSADFPAAAAALLTMIGTNSNAFCRHACLYSRRL